MTTMIKCPCGCGWDVINFYPTNEEMHDKLEKEYFAAIKERYDPCVSTLLLNLFLNDERQSNLDRARDRLARYEEKHG